MKSRDFVENCLAAGKFSKGQKERLRRKIYRAKKALMDEHHMSESEAEKQAATDVLDAELLKLAHEMTRLQKQELLQAANVRKLTEGVKTFNANINANECLAKFFGKRQGMNAYASIMALLLPDHYNTGLTVSMWNRVKAIEADLHAILRDVIEASRIKMAGLKNDQQAFEQIAIDAIDGKDTPMASALNRAVDYLADRFNEAGGSIRKLKGYGLHHSHDTYKIVQASANDWINFILPRLHPERMDKDGTMRELDSQRAFLHKVYEGIVSHVIEDYSGIRNVSRNRKYLKFYEYHQLQRKLHFKDGQSFVEYHNRFGQGSLYESVMTNMRSRVQEIAAMEQFGPDPVRALTTLTKIAKKTHGLTQGQADKLTSSWFHLTGEATTVRPHPQDQALATMGRIGMTTSLASFMGSAMIPAIVDTVTVRAMLMKNQAAWIRGPLSLMAQMANPEFTTSRKERLATDVKRLLHEAEWAISNAPRVRMLGDAVGAEKSERVNDLVVRLQMLGHWTNTARSVSRRHFTNSFAQNADLEYSRLGQFQKQVLDSYNISALEWDDLRATMFKENDAFELFDLSNLDNKELRVKWLAYIENQTARAVPMNASKTTRILHGYNKSGTLTGKLRRSTQFFSYSTSIWLNHIRHELYNNSSTPAFLINMGGLFTFMTLMGAVAVTNQEISKGKKPPSWNSVDFWRSAAFKGGGLSFIGDVMFQDVKVDSLDVLLDILLDPSLNFWGDLAVELGAEPLGQGLWGGESNLYQQALTFPEEWTLGHGYTMWHLSWLWERAVKGALQDAHTKPALHLLPDWWERTIKGTFDLPPKSWNT